MSFEWQPTTLGEICEAQGGSIQTGPFGSQLHTSDYKELGIPVVMPTNIGEGGIDESGIARIDSFDVERLSQHKLKIGDIVFSRRGDVTKNALVRSHEVGWLCGTGCLKVRLGDETIAVAKFISHCLRLPETKEWLIRHAVGATMPNLNTGILSAVPINLPPLKAQLDIAATLGALDDRITMLRETNATLEAIARVLFKSWFVDFDPVHAKAAGVEPEGIDAATAALFPDGFEELPEGLVPKGWSVGRADSWLSVLETGRRPKGGVAGIVEGVPSIGAESIVRVGEFDYSKTKYVSPEFFDKMKSGGIQSHDVLLYKDGGKPGVFLPRVSMFGDGFPFERCGINEHVFRIRLKEPFGQAFLYCWLWSDSVMHELKHRGGKAAIPGINQADVKELNLLIPDEHALKRFDVITSPLISTIFSNSKQAQTLTQLRDSLLPRLISGQLTLPEAEAQIEVACA